MSVAFDLEPDPRLRADGEGAKPGSRRRRRAALIATVAAALTVVLATAAYVAVVATHPLPAVAAVVPAEAIRAIETPAVQPAWPAQGSAAVGLVGDQQLLGSHGSDASVPIASLTKTITALVLLDKYPVGPGEQGPTITFGQRDVDILHQVWSEDGSWANVQPGEQLTLTQALTAMLLPSANNYARSLAEWSYGSQPAFVDAANAWLQKHGFSHTHMTDPSGFDQGSVSNLSDLVGIGELAISDPALAAVVDTPSATLPVVGKLTNTNPLLGQDGIEGVKTGFTDQAGHCLMFAATVTINAKKRTLVGVMLGQPQYADLWANVPKLLASYEQGFHLLDLTDAGTTVYGSYRTPWGSTTKLLAATRPSLELYSAGTVTVTVAADPVATVAADAEAGTVTFSSGSRKLVAELTTTDAIAPPSLWWRLTHPADIL